MARHVAHRLDIFSLSIPKLLVERLELRLQNTNVAIDMIDILLNTSNVLLVVVYLAIDKQQLIELLADLRFILLEGLLLLPNLPLNSGALVLQLPDGGIGVGRRILLRALRITGFPLAGLGTACRLTYRLLPRLSSRRQHKCQHH